MGEKVNDSLYGQVGMQAGIPTVAKVQSPASLAFAPDSSADAVIALGTLGAVGSFQTANFLQVRALLWVPSWALCCVL